MIPDGADTVICRYGEIGVRSKRVRKDMTRRLQENLQALLSDRNIPATVERTWGRVLIRCDPEDLNAATATAADTFGIVSVSPAARVEPEKQAFITALRELADDAYTGGSFAVRVHRAGQDGVHDFSSPELEREAGAQIVADHDAPVDLETPDQTFYAEARDKEGYVYLEKRSGPAGLPMEPNQRVIALISGGHDSPVAAYEMMRRGCSIIPVYIDLGPYAGPDHTARAYEAVKALQRYVPGRDLQVRRVPAGEFAQHLVDTVEKTRMLVLRQFMFAVAAQLAKQERAKGIVTGESIGQKSSQTLQNLSVTSQEVDLPIHRPLLTWDKNDIIQQARAIQTHGASSIPAGCERLAPDRVATQASLEDVAANRPAEFDSYVADAVQGIIVESP